MYSAKSCFTETQFEGRGAVHGTVLATGNQTYTKRLIVGVASVGIQLYLQRPQLASVGKSHLVAA